MPEAFAPPLPPTATMHDVNDRRSYARAARRLQTWERCLIDSTLKLADELRQDGEPAGEPILEPVRRAVEALDRAAQLGTAAGDDAPWESGLRALNMELRKALTSHPFRLTRERGSEIVRGLYAAAIEAPEYFAAALALFDVFMDELERMGPAARWRGTEAPTDLLLWRELFDHVSYGFGAYALLRRWRNIFLTVLEPGQFESLEEEAGRDTAERSQDAAAVIRWLRRRCRQLGIEASIESYQRSWAGLAHSQLPRKDIVRAIFLNIECYGPEHDCLAVDGLMSQYGEVVERFLRRTFYVPQRNGARRLQTAVRLGPDGHHRLCVARISTPQRRHYNEWGRLLNMLANGSYPLTEFTWAPDRPAGAARETTIDVYDGYGRPYRLPVSATVRDFILESHPHTYQYISSITVNLQPADDTEARLLRGDVVFVKVDRSQKSALPPRYTAVAHEAAGRGEPDDSVRGRTYAMLLVNTYLKSWGQEIDENGLYALLKQQNSYPNLSKAQAFARLATQDSRAPNRDDDLCKLALQYVTRGRIEQRNGEALPLTWQSVHLAHCCHPNPGQAIVGNYDPGPSDPDQQPYRVPSIRVHTEACRNAPTHIDRRLPLRWVGRDYFGALITLRIPEYVGSLTDLLRDITSSTNLLVKFVAADGIHFAPAYDMVSLTVIARTQRQLDEGIAFLRATYGDDAVTTQMLDWSDIGILTSEAFKNPFMRGEADVRMLDRVPQDITRRSKEFEDFNLYVRSNARIIVLLGYFKMGKTTMLQFMRQQYATPGYVPVYLTLHTLGKALTPEEFVRQICLATTAAVRGRVDLKEAKLPNWQSSVERLPDFFEDIHKATGCRILVMIDEFTALNDVIRFEGEPAKTPDSRIDGRFLERLARSFELAGAYASFVLVFQAAVVNKLVRAHQGLLDLVQQYAERTVNIGKMTRHELIDFLVKPMIGKKMLVQEDAIEALYDLSGGIIYIAQIIASWWWQNTVRGGSDDQPAMTAESLYATAGHLLEEQHRTGVDSQLYRLVDQLDRGSYAVLQALARLTQEDGPASVDQVAAASGVHPHEAALCLDAFALCDLATGGEHGWRLTSRLLRDYLADAKKRQL
jgi:hypothetical protein